MYWLWFSLILLVPVISIIILIYMVIRGDAEDAGGCIYFIVLGIGAFWMYIEKKDYNSVTLPELKTTQVSIMSDKEVAILRYGEWLETYKSKKEYDIILDSTFTVGRVQTFDIFGEDNGTTYTLKPVEKK